MSDTETGDHRYEVEVECRWAGSTVVEADSGEEARQKVEDLDKSEVIFNDMSPGVLETKGVYSLDK